MKHPLRQFTAAMFFIVACAVSTWATAQNVNKKKAKPPQKATQAVSAGTPYASRPEVMDLVPDIAARRDLDPSWVRRALGEARHLPNVARLMQPPAQGFVKNWRVYRSRFIDPVRIGAGVRFWQANRETLERAERDYGVPAEIIVGVIGVETIYGQQMGSFRVMDALATLAFNFPTSHPRAAERSEYFRGELEQFLTLQSRLGADPLQPVGSYAGATGMPQFMPTSRVKYAVDYDGDGSIDLSNNAADVIGSVASYFKAFNWVPGMPTHYPVRFAANAERDALLAPDILPTFSLQRFQALGAVVEGEALQHSGPLALVELQNGPEAAQYVAGTENFYAITRYNWSSYYAMAVIELGREVKVALARTTVTR